MGKSLKDKKVTNTKNKTKTNSGISKSSILNYIQQQAKKNVPVKQCGKFLSKFC